MHVSEIDENGFRILENVLDAETVSGLKTELAALEPSGSIRRKNVNRALST